MPIVIFAGEANATHPFFGPGGLKNIKANLKNTNTNRKDSSVVKTAPRNFIDSGNDYIIEAGIIDRLIEMGGKMNTPSPIVVDIDKISAKKDKYDILKGEAEARLIPLKTKREAALQEYQSFVENHVRYNPEKNAVELEKQIELYRVKAPNDLTNLEINACKRIRDLNGIGKALKPFVTAHAEMIEQDKIITYWIHEIGKLKDRISGAENVARQAADPSNQLVARIEILIRSAYGPGANPEDIQNLRTEISKKIRKGVVEESLYQAVKLNIDLLSNYLDRANKKEPFSEASLGSLDNSSEIQGLREEIQKLLKDNQLLRGQLLERSTRNSSDAYSIELNETIPDSLEFSTSYPVSAANTSQGEAVIKIVDDKTHQGILVGLESLEQLLDMDGTLNTALIKYVFEQKYVQDAVIAIQKDTGSYQEVIEELIERGVTLCDIGTDNSDGAVQQLDDYDKALLYLHSMDGVDATAIRQGKKYIAINRGVAAGAVNMALANIIDTRMLSAGIAAGDEAETKTLAIQGLWTSGLYGLSYQKAHSEVLGYKGKTAGGTIGVDFIIDNDVLVGIACSKVNSNFTGSKSTVNKIKTESDILSIYSKIDLNDKLDVAIIASGNRAQITHKYNKLTGLNKYKIATAKFCSKGFNTHIMFNYKLATASNIMIVPHIGLNYGKQYDGSCTESGTGIHNLSISAKNNNELVGIFGAKIFRTLAVGNSHVTPSLTTSLQNHFSNKKHKIVVNYSWADKSAAQQLYIGRPAQFSYNIGIGLLVQRSNLEIATEYNCRLKKQYHSHQGALKLKLLF
jgi:outer membrane autotransporter protein